MCGDGEFAAAVVVVAVMMSVVLLIDALTRGTSRRSSISWRSPHLVGVGVFRLLVLQIAEIERRVVVPFEEQLNLAELVGVGRRIVAASVLIASEREPTSNGPLVPKALYLKQFDDRPRQGRRLVMGWCEITPNMICLVEWFIHGAEHGSIFLKLRSWYQLKVCA